MELLKVENLYNVYQSDEPIEFVIKTAESDIEYERKHSELTDEKDGIPIRHFTDSHRLDEVRAALWGMESQAHHRARFYAENGYVSKYLLPPCA